MPHRRTSSLLALLLLLTVSCGGPESTTGSPGESPALVIAWENAPANLDPRIGTDIASGRISDLVHSGLVRVLPSGDYEGDLAESWEISDDRTIVFRLREGLTFHDGRRLTAADVKFTYDSLMAADFPSPKKSGYATVASIEAPDERTVIFRLKEPNGGLFDNLTLGIVPAGADANIYRSRPIGAGPYRVMDNLPDERVDLEVFPAYHGGAAQIRRVVFRIIPDTTTRVLELERGGVGMVINALPLDSVGQFESKPNLRTIASPGSRWV